MIVAASITESRTSIFTYIINYRYDEKSYKYNNEKEFDKINDDCDNNDANCTATILLILN